MKLLSVPLFTVLTVVVYADQYVFPPVHSVAMPMHEVVTIYEMPSYPISEIVYVSEHDPGGRIAPPTPHAVAKPAEREITVPRPLEPLTPLTPPPLPSSPPTPPTLLAPRLPPPMEEQEQEIVRGQSRSVDELAGLLGSPPPLARGAVEEGAIEPKLLGTIDSTELEGDVLAASIVRIPAQTTAAGQETKSADPLAYMVLLMATGVTTLGLLYMVFVAYDYRQRWMQSLTMQNDRFLVGGAFDMEKMEDAYSSYSGSPLFSESFGLTRRSI